MAPTLDLTFLRYVSAITEQKKCWELLAQKIDRFQTLRHNCQQATTFNNLQQGSQTDATCNIQHVASVCTWLEDPFLCPATWYYDCVYYEVSLKFN